MLYVELSPASKSVQSRALHEALISDGLRHGKLCSEGMLVDRGGSLNPHYASVRVQMLTCLV
jgi:hypothetical protein